MNILITGATGFLGRHLSKRLFELGHTLCISNSTTGNLHNYNDFCLRYADTKFDVIFHLAAKTKAGDYCMYHKGEQWIDNQLLNTNMLRYWYNFQPQAKMVAMGTGCTYHPIDGFLEEEDCIAGDPEPELYTYAHTKRMLLIGLRSIAEQYNLKYLYLIPSTLFGTDFVLHDNHFIFDLIKKIYEGKHKGEDVILWGNGHQRRELIYVDDAVQLMIDLLSIDNEVVNLCTGKDYSIREFAEIICKLVDYNPDKIIYDESRYTGALVKKLSPNKLMSLAPPHFKFTPTEDGIKQTLDYYISSRK
jgi:GDP-L-fucose synthase